MYYLIDQSTDQREPRTQIVRTSSEKRAKEWLSSKQSGRLTYPGSTTNYHHSFHDVYELKGPIDYRHKIFSYFGTSFYPKNRYDQMLEYLYLYGERYQLSKVSP